MVILTGVMALALGIAGWHLPDNRPRFYWRCLFSCWALLTVLVWLEYSYLANLRQQFYSAVAVTVIVLVLFKRLFPWPVWLVQAVNTGLLLLIGLPLADCWLARRVAHEEFPNPHQRLFSYEVARQDPPAFARWWNHFVQEWNRTLTAISVPDSNGVAPFILRPGSVGKTFESEIRINSLGFRGAEFAREKGRAYRIIALGESTTFGHTLFAGDRPWPEVLEQMIADRFPPDRPVQVINAGIPSYDLRHNLRRLTNGLLALQPDMIISYHGYNGFEWLIPTLPPVFGPAAPHYEERPLKLLADVEYRMKLLVHGRRKSAASDRAAMEGSPRNDRYTGAYREVITLTRTNHIQLVLANYSMAVNARSALPLIEFYRGGFPDVFKQIRANEMHSEIVATLARQSSEVLFVDTHPTLDGKHELYIDLVHFTQPGRNAMAETVFQAIRPLLESTLGDPKISPQ